MAQGRFTSLHGTTSSMQQVQHVATSTAAPAATTVQQLQPPIVDQAYMLAQTALRAQQQQLLSAAL